jgi:AcrR family transcriptional regulator
VRTAVFSATLLELAENGYVALSVERIADRAGVHKTTVYRRWRTKDALLAVAIAALVGDLFPMPSYESIAEDLRSLGRSLVDLLTSDVPTVQGAVRALFFDAANVAQIAELKRHLYAQRYQQAESFVSAAIDRGELPSDTDTRELVGLVMASIYYRKLVTNEPIDHRVSDCAAATALAAIRAGACRCNR